MAEAKFRIHGDLDYFLGSEQQANNIVYDFDPNKDGSVAVKHAIEALGIPHPEVDRIMANGQVVGFDYGLHTRDVIDVLAWIPKPDWVNLRPPLPRPVRFVVDTHLGRLASYLRLLGFNALYRNDYTDAELAESSYQDARVLLTRDRGLLKRSIVDFGFCVRETNPAHQIVSLIQRYHLRSEVDPWQRCLRCNTPLTPVAKSEIIDQLEPKTKRYYHDFRRCAGCGQIYWPGSHYERMQGFIDSVLTQAAQPTHEPHTPVGQPAST